MNRYRDEENHEQRASCQLRSKHFEHLEETEVGEQLNIDTSTEDIQKIVEPITLQPSMVKGN